MRGDDDAIGRQAAARRLHDARLVVVDLDGPRLLMDRPAGGDERGRQRGQVAMDVELRLVVEAHRAGRGIRERRGLDERGRKARLAGRLGLGLDVGALAVRRGVGVGRSAPQVAVDAAVLHAAADPLERGLVGGTVGMRRVGAEARAQRVVDQPVLRGDLGGRVAGDAVPHARGLQQHHVGPASATSAPSDAGDATAEHRHIGARVVLQRRVLRRVGLEPERALMPRASARAPPAASATRRCAPWSARARAGSR